MTDRELDLLVAQHLFGFKLDHHVFSSPLDERGTTLTDHIERYSSTGDGMLAVMEEMGRRGYLVQVGNCDEAGFHFEAPEVSVRAEHGDWVTNDYATAVGKSIPHEVCVTSLRAIGAMP